MRRRDFLTKLPGLATMPLMLPQAAQAAQGANLKVTDVRLIKIKLVEDKGILARRVDTPRGGLHVQIGNFTVTEVHTNHGLVVKMKVQGIAERRWMKGEKKISLKENMLLKEKESL